MSSIGNGSILHGSSLPYISDFVQALLAMKAWITTGGIAQISDSCESSGTLHLTMSDPPSKSEGKYKAPGSDNAPQEELPTPCQLGAKVAAVRSGGGTLNKGAWATNPAMHQGCHRFLSVFLPFARRESHSNLKHHTQGGDPWRVVCRVSMTMAG